MYYVTRRYTSIPTYVIFTGRLGGSEGNMRKNAGGLEVLSSKVPPELAETVRRIAREQEITVSQVIQTLLEQALVADGELALEEGLGDRGYHAGLKRGLHEVREHMKKLWGEGS